MKKKLIVVFLMGILSLNANDLAFWDNYIASGTKYQVDPYVLYAIAEVESGNDSNATSGDGDVKSVGLMQIKSMKYSTAMLLDPATNIDLGAKRVKECKRFFNNQWVAIDCYHVGAKEARVDTEYVKRVKMILKIISR